MTRTIWATWITLLAASIVAPIAAAQPSGDARRDQVAAATARAVDRLRTQIAAEPVGREWTVGDVLDATKGNETLVKTLQRSQMIGGPRWLDDQTCQVRLEISGPRVRAALVDIAAANPKKSPIDPQLLQGRLKTWDNRTFCATSTSTGATLDQLRPVEEGPAWEKVSDAARQQAIAAAKRNAIGSVILAMGPIPLAAGKTVADALADSRVRGPVDQWLASRPGTAVQFHDDLRLDVTLATPGAELADVFLSALQAAKPPVVSLDEAAKARVKQAFAERVPPSPRGSARAGEVGAAKGLVALPSVPPSWASDQIDADGSGISKSSRLKAARAAEADAQSKLRAKVDALPLAKDLTVGQAARQDPHVAAAIERTISRTRASKVDYQPDGSARVRVTLELHDLWDALSDR